MNLQQVTHCFNDKAYEFVSDLCRLVPTDSEFKAFKASVRLVNTMDAEQAIRVFVEHVTVPYGEQIVDRNEDFFLSPSFDDTLDKVDDFVQPLVARIRGYWGSINDDDKNVVWDYLNLLHALAEQFHNISEKLRK